MPVLLLGHLITLACLVGAAGVWGWLTGAWIAAAVAALLLAPVLSAGLFALAALTAPLRRPGP